MVTSPRHRRAGAGLPGPRHDRRVAPEQNASGTSNALDAEPAAVGVPGPRRGWRGYINGTPSDCVHVALTGLLPHRPDLVLSGINNGANMGDDTLYSGTVAAAMEGFLFGIPAIAFSQVEKGWGHLDAAARTARAIIDEGAGRRPARRPWLLNVNIPNRADADSCRARSPPGPAPCQRAGDPQDSPRGDPIYWIGPAGDAREAGEGTDFHATANGLVSITPLQVDLTDHARLRAWAAARRSGREHER
jgi:5'-nucleotidase